jgi:hypothetical protein
MIVKDFIARGKIPIVPSGLHAVSILTARSSLKAIQRNFGVADTGGIIADGAAIGCYRPDAKA